jgi:hypothetical protein
VLGLATINRVCPMKPLDFFNLPNHSSCTMTVGLTQLLTAMSTRNLTGGWGGGGSGKAGTARKTSETPSPSVSQLSRKCGILNVSQPYRLPQPVTGIGLLSTWQHCNPSLRSCSPPPGAPPAGAPLLCHTSPVWAGLSRVSHK